MSALAAKAPVFEQPPSSLETTWAAMRLSGLLGATADRHSNRTAFRDQTDRDQWSGRQPIDWTYPLAYDVIEQNHDVFAFDVKRCAYAEFYKALGEPELGFLLICTADFATAKGFGSDISLTRTQTIMQGADHCDFRYRRDAGEGHDVSAASDSLRDQ